MGGGRPRQDGGGTGVAEADGVSGQVGEVHEQGAEAVDGLAVFGAFVKGFLARGGRDLGLGDGGGSLGGCVGGIVVLEQHRGEVALHAT